MALSLSTARRLRAGGLAWTPALRDCFGIPVPVNILGRVIGDATRFRAVKDGTQVQITRAD
jgi:hypothetical protein